MRELLDDVGSLACLRHSVTTIYIRRSRHLSAIRPISVANSAPGALTCELIRNPCKDRRRRAANISDEQVTRENWSFQVTCVNLCVSAG
jgi:hypothetical protein